MRWAAQRFALAVLYLAGIVPSFFVLGLARAMNLIAALIWLVPDRRIDRALAHETP